MYHNLFPREGEWFLVHRSSPMQLYNPTDLQKGKYLQHKPYWYCFYCRLLLIVLQKNKKNTKEKNRDFLNRVEVNGWLSRAGHPIGEFDESRCYYFAKETQKQKNRNSYQKPMCLTNIFSGEKKIQDKNIVIDSEIKSAWNMRTEVVLRCRTEPAWQVAECSSPDALQLPELLTHKQNLKNTFRKQKNGQVNAALYHCN